MTIQNLVIELTPFQFSNHRELNINIIVDGEEYHSRELIPKDDLLSIFDWMWQRCGMLFKEQLKKEPESVKK